MPRQRFTSSLIQDANCKNGLLSGLQTEAVIDEQRLGECSAKFALPGCHTGGPVRWSVAGRGKAAISYFHLPTAVNRSQALITNQ